MKSPVKFSTRNLVWTQNGSVWATWRLEPMAYGLKPDKDKRNIRALHTHLYRCMPGEFLLLGLNAAVAPSSVVSTTIEGVDLVKHPAVTEEAEANLDRLDQLEMGRRVFYLSVPLPNEGIDRIREPLLAGLGDFKINLGLPVSKPSAADVARRIDQARVIERALPFAFSPCPITVREHLWIFRHAVTRGLVDSEIPRQWVQDGAEDSEILQLQALPTPVLDVAGQTDVLSTRDKINPLRRRFLKVSSEAGDSYQASLVVSATPDGGLLFPGGEWLANLDLTGESVDFAQRVRISSSTAVARRNAKTIRDLNDQVDQRSTDAAAYAGSGGLDKQIGDLAEYIALLNADKDEVETESTTIFTVAADSRESLEESVNRVEHVVGSGGWGFSLSREPGTSQEDLWWSGQPGTPTSALDKSMAQITTSAALSVAVPITTTQLGDYSGPLLGMEISGGKPSPVLIDLEAAAEVLNVSPSLACVGELGAGKSVLLKTVGLHLKDRGSHVVAIDRSETGEWVSALSSVENLKVVDVSKNAQVSLDPLRVLGADGPQKAKDFLLALLGASAGDSTGGLIGEVLDEESLSKYNINSLSDAVAALGNIDGDLAADVQRRLRSFARQKLCRSMFDPTLPPLSLDDEAVVFRTQALTLPSAAELAESHRFKSMSLEKTFSRAVYGQLVAVARTICFSNPQRLDVLIADEAHAVTLSDESTADIEKFVRDGRKHKAAILLGSHDPQADFGDSDVLRRLISWRLVMRHRDEVLAQRSLTWLGMDATKERLKKVTEDLSPIPAGRKKPDPARMGECLVRDARNRFGQMKVLAPAARTRGQDVMSTPSAEVAV